MRTDVGLLTHSSRIQPVSTFPAPSVTAQYRRCILFAQRGRAAAFGYPYSLVTRASSSALSPPDTMPHLPALLGASTAIPPPIGFLSALCHLVIVAFYVCRLAAAAVLGVADDHSMLLELRSFLTHTGPPPARVSCNVERSRKSFVRSHCLFVFRIIFNAAVSRTRYPNI